MDQTKELSRWLAWRANNPKSNILFPDWLRQRALEDASDIRNFGLTWDQYLQEHDKD